MKKQIKYTYKKKYIVRQITEDGLVKRIEGRGGYGYREYACDNEYETEEDAVADIEKEGLYDVVIIAKVSQEAIWE